MVIFCIIWIVATLIIGIIKIVSPSTYNSIPTAHAHRHVHVHREREHKK